MFDQESGRPSGDVIRTSLLERLDDWAGALAAGEAAPRVILLIGGPGNGKTEAVESTIRTLDNRLGGDGKIVGAFAPMFSPREGVAVPRLARVEATALVMKSPVRNISVVQDASVPDPALPGLTPAALLVRDLSQQLDAGDIYLACVNRGVLDEALIATIEGRDRDVQSLISTIVEAVGLSPDAPPCWPLPTRSDVAVWPMDVESLLAVRSSGDASPAHQLLASATQSELWADEGQCQAGDHCPFCTSRAQLVTETHRDSLLRILRWYELATGKRWSFRDLFSLLSYLLAGTPVHPGDEVVAPCEWAARLLEMRAKPTAKPDSLRLRAPFLLVAAQYQHALFGRWPRLTGRGLRGDLKELKLDHQPALLGLHYFLSAGRGIAVPATLAPQLQGMADGLDPALANPDDDVDVSSRSAVKLRDIDARFSQSTREGLSFIRKYRCLSPLETDLLLQLADADDALGEGEGRRRRPATAARVQMLVREFACRLVRRSLGTRSAVVRDAATLNAFQAVIDGDEQLLHEAVKQVEALLNERDRFVVSLNTTFGEPLPPERGRATLTTDRQKVRPKEATSNGRPKSSLRFLSVGQGGSSQSIPLTYELFRSVRELRSGMMPASLPRPVVALLDTTRARLSGRIVRDEGLLDGAEIRIGLRNEVIVRELKKFVLRQEVET